MKRLKKRWIRMLAVLACLMGLLAAAPVQAANLSEETKAALGESAQSYVQTALSLTEDEYDMIYAEGGFYEVLVDAWRDARDDTGALVSIGEAEVTQDGDMVECSMPAEFEHYDGEVVMTFEMDSTGAANPRNFVLNVDYPLSKSLEEAGINTAIGLIIVFAILFFLCGVIYLIRFVNPDLRKQKTEQVPPAQEKKPETPVPAAAPVPAAPAAASPEEDIELAIVLATAIAAAEAENPTGDGYVVRSVRKIRNKNWKRV